jgi:hypothetical protein
VLWSHLQRRLGVPAALPLFLVSHTTGLAESKLESRAAGAGSGWATVPHGRAAAHGMPRSFECAPGVQQPGRLEACQESTETGALLGRSVSAARNIMSANASTFDEALMSVSDEVMGNHGV